MMAAAKREKMGWDEICKRAAKVISFIDLAGHERSVHLLEGLG
jgi:GTPase